jgi:hypothetical protein
LINSTEAGNLLRGNGALHAMLDAHARARARLVLVTRMSYCLISKLFITFIFLVDIIPSCVISISVPFSNPIKFPQLIQFKIDVKLFGLGWCFLENVNLFEILSYILKHDWP